MNQISYTPLQQVINNITSKLHPELREAARTEAKLILMHVLGVDRTTIELQTDMKVNQDEYREVTRLAALRLQGMPLAKIIGTKEFWSLLFNVTQDTLDPRPDSETLIEAILDNRADFLAPYKILDLGTGSGCLLLALLSEYHHAQGVGVDISQAALEVAKRNAENLNLSERAKWLKGNWFEKVQGQYDIIITNPPYITEENFYTLDRSVRDYDPYQALVSGVTGLEDYKKIICSVDKYLANDGIFAIEIGINQEQSVPDILTEYGFTTLEIRNDLAGIPRCVLARK